MSAECEVVNALRDHIPWYHLQAALYGTISDLSSFNYRATDPQSSAYGLFQFTEPMLTDYRTWLGTGRDSAERQIRYVMDCVGFGRLIGDACATELCDAVQTEDIEEIVCVFYKIFENHAFVKRSRTIEAASSYVAEERSKATQVIEKCLDANLSCTSRERDREFLEKMWARFQMDDCPPPLRPMLLDSLKWHGLEMAMEMLQLSLNMHTASALIEDALKVARESRDIMEVVERIKQLREQCHDHPSMDWIQWRRHLAQIQLMALEALPPEELREDAKGWLTGAEVDMSDGKIVFFGKGARHLKALKYLQGALLAYRQQERYEIAFSLDPEDPRNSESLQKKVHYPPILAGTVLGEAMFAADFLMKKLAIGTQRFPAALQRLGLKSIADLDEDCRSEPERARLWFVIEGVEKATSSPNKLLLTSVRLAVKAKRTQLGASGLEDVETDPRLPCVQFAELFSRHFDAIAEHFEEIRELEVASWAVILAKWLANSQLPLKDELLGNAIEVQTSTTVPAQSATYTYFPSPYAYSVRTLSGGVSFEVDVRSIGSRASTTSDSKIGEVRTQENRKLLDCYREPEPKTQPSHSASSMKLESKKDMVKAELQKNVPNFALRAAMYGNISVESPSFDYEQVEVKKGRGPKGKGLFQFTGNTEKDYNKWLQEKGKENSAESQIQYTNDCLETGRYIGPGNAHKIKEAAKSGDVERTTKAFCDHFEKPGVPHIERRIKAAHEYSEAE